MFAPQAVATCCDDLVLSCSCPVPLRSFSNKELLQLVAVISCYHVRAPRRNALFSRGTSSLHSEGMSANWRQGTLHQGTSRACIFNIWPGLQAAKITHSPGLGLCLFFVMFMLHMLRMLDLSCFKYWPCRVANVGHWHCQQTDSCTWSCF